MSNIEALIAKYSAPVPRYTSYPTAPHFNDSLDEATYRSWLGKTGREEAVSVYVHIPFCDRLCWFCGCHTKHTTRYDPVAAYLKVLYREIELAGAAIGFKPVLGQLHLGGGSPSLIKFGDMAELRDRLESVFRFDDNAQISVEIDPSDATEDMYAGLAALGLNRASIGVQDFDPAVQKAINRPQTFEDTRDVIARLRAMGIRSMNIDALYGLPHQTIATLEKTMSDVLSLNPDRIALFGYAHVPWMKKHQQMIDEASLPDAGERYRQARHAEAILQQAGYVAIGIDHFARPGDSLAQAAQNGQVNRNFQGYTDDPCETLIGFGASSIGRTRFGYVQNITATGQYMAAVKDGKLPVGRGLVFSQDDIIRGAFIERLMSDFAVDLKEFGRRHGAGAAPVLREAALRAQDDTDGLCRIRGDRFEIPADRRPFARTVASWFDAYMKNREARYSVAL